MNSQSSSLVFKEVEFSALLDRGEMNFIFVGKWIVWAQVALTRLHRYKVAKRKI